MTAKNTQKFRDNADGVTFVDPTETDFTVRFKTTANPKSLGDARVQNYISEIIINDLNNVTVAGATVQDAVSVRLRVSGAAESMARIKAIVDNLATQIGTWETENVFLGFEPTTVPTNPA